MVDVYSRESAPRHKSRCGIVPIAQQLWSEQASDLGSHAVARRVRATRPDDAHGIPLAFLSRFIVLQAIGAAAIAGLWVVGVAGKPFAGNNGFLCWLIAAIGALGILCVFLRRWRDVDWLATHVVRIGLLGTVVGLIVAFSAARTGGSADPNAIRPMIASVIDGMYVALYATLLGIATNLWLKINLRLLGNFDG
ncbi:MotA/TolQ/ExbB proton channel family protein [Mesorhizobium sp. M0019]|uniref:MotA/TolQ/ExbB proton channel family protein n=1 Tax=Mesorhizobium sp. M0019 TaxID=2956845 RepID=UPI0033389FBB